VSWQETGWFFSVTKLERPQVPAHYACPCATFYGRGLVGFSQRYPIGEGWTIAACGGRACELVSPEIELDFEVVWWTRSSRRSYVAFNHAVTLARGTGHYVA